ncbi:molybdenum cofactor guanylyltransferase [Malonomonas rubra]|uniref:molybdenum cofactor guanylyltransferase n=1 Tax=Malonomonas rubra TaxID=57040 RepID=UPI0026F1F79C|nr:molybdenum cofactor guanylyltransferase [Malonomonas rubra]
MYLSKTGIQTFSQTKFPAAVEKISAAPAGKARQGAEHSDSDSPAGRIRLDGSITGVILAGGQSRRMGRNKALLDMGGIPLIEKTYRTMAKLFSEVILITNTPEEYAFLNCRCQPDIYPGVGSIAGLHAALSASHTERIFVVPCDMPLLSPELITLLCQTDPTYDAVVPFSRMGLEPLHALYHRRCLPQLERAIRTGDIKIQNVLQDIWTYFLPVCAYRHIPDAEHSFQNINRPEDYAALGIQQTEPSIVSSHEFGAQ